MKATLVYSTSNYSRHSTAGRKNINLTVKSTSSNVMCAKYGRALTTETSKKELNKLFIN